MAKKNDLGISSGSAYDISKSLTTPHYSAVTKNGKTTYYETVGGKKTKITQAQYKKGTTPTYSKKTVDGKTTYYKKDPQTGKTTKVSKAEYTNRTSKNPQPYKDGGKYYDKNGKEVSKATWDKQKAAIKATNAVNNSKVSWTKQSSSWKNDYQGTAEDLANKMATAKDPKLKDLKSIKDNAEYLTTRDAIAKSLVNGTYYDQETDPYAKQLREDYTRQGQRAANDTMAQLARRSGGLASSYAGAVAASKYNDYMDALAGKLIDLRKVAEASARNNMTAYEMFNDDYRKGQIQNNDVITQNNANAMNAWNAYMQKLGSALDAYNALGTNSFNRWQATQQMYQNQQQHKDDMAYKYAVLAAQQQAQEPTYIGGGTGGGNGSYSNSGIDGTSTAVLAKQAPYVAGDQGKGSPEMTIGEWANQVKTEEALKRANGTA